MYRFIICLQKSESPPPVSEEDTSFTRSQVLEPVSDSLPEWVPPADETTPEVSQESIASGPKEEAARSPLKR